MKWINFVKQPPKESGRYFVKGCHLPGQFEWDGEYLIDWRGEPLEDIDEDIEYLDESPSSDPAEVLVKAIPADVARKILLVRDALVKRDMEGAYHHLYSIASPKFDQYEPWKELEEIAKHEQLKQQ